MPEKKLEFKEVMELINHIGEEERHFNSLELEYRKLASQWLLVSLAAIGFVLSKEAVLPIDSWLLIISICLAASVGILVLWLLDLKVYHELLHAVYKEGVKLEDDYPEYLPRIRNNMKNSQTGGDIVKRVIYYYFFSILLLLLIANISVWMTLLTSGIFASIVNIVSVVIAYSLHRLMMHNSVRNFGNNS